MSLSSIGNVRYHFDNSSFTDPLYFGPFKIFQFGDIDVLPGYKCSEHEQAVNEITYIVNGSVQFVCNGQQITVRAGDLVFNPKGSRHEIKAINNSAARYYYIAFAVNGELSETEQKLKEFYASKEPFSVAAERSVLHAFRDIFLNFLNNDDFSKALIADAIRKLLVSVVRSENGKNDGVPFEKHQEKNRTLSQICSFIDHNAEDINILKKLPQKFGYSYSYISSVFSKSMGISLKEYHLLSRHKRECELLKENLSVTAVADRMGYSSIHAFSHAFTAREGISPKGYIDKERKDIK